MSDDSQPLGGLSRFDLSTTFRCAVELAEAAAALDPSEWSTVPVDIKGPASPRFERWMERDHRLQRIAEETERLKRSLGATGSLGHADVEADGGPKWESFDQRFNNTSHDRIVRLALFKLATAAIDLSGFATWREWQWQMRETGLRLLTWGLAQLWEGMSEDERSRVRERLPRTSKAIGWPLNATTDPPCYDGPEEIPVPDQYRIISKYVSCYRGYENDVQESEARRVEQQHEMFLRVATQAQFVEAAQLAAKALQAMANRDYDTPAQWGDLYTKVVWPLTCLRRAHEIPPRETWPAAALEQRNMLADAAKVLYTSVCGTPDAKAGLKPADVDKALDEFTTAIEQLKDEAKGQFTAPDAAHSTDMRPSRDFASIQWGTECFTFNPRQAACISVMWEAFSGDGPNLLHQNTILAIAEDNYQELVGLKPEQLEGLARSTRLRNVFKEKQREHRAWKSMIIGDGKGNFGLQAPMKSRDSHDTPT